MFSKEPISRMVEANEDDERDDSKERARQQLDEAEQFVLISVGKGKRVQSVFASPEFIAMAVMTLIGNWRESERHTH